MECAKTYVISRLSSFSLSFSIVIMFYIYALSFDDDRVIGWSFVLLWMVGSLSLAPRPLCRVMCWWVLYNKSRRHKESRACRITVYDIVCGWALTGEATIITKRREREREREREQERADT